jgi:Domain of unknown function (DUF4878)
MKNAVKYFSLVAIAALVLVACGKSYSPKEVADNFFKALQEKKYDEAKKFATPASSQAIDQFKDYLSADAAIKFSYVVAAEPTVNGEEATVGYTSDGAQKTANLKKVDGDWLVDIKIEELLGDAGAPEETPIETAPTADAQQDTAAKK